MNEKIPYYSVTLKMHELMDLPKEKRLNMLEINILSYLYNMQYHTDKEPYVSNKRLCEIFRLSDSRVKAILKKLRDSEMITTRIEYKKGTLEVDKRYINTNLFKDWLHSNDKGISVTEGEQPEQPKEEVPKERTKKTENKDKPKQTKETENIPYQEIIEYLNEELKTRYKPTTKLTQKNIKARWKEGFTLEDFKTVVDNKKYEWEGTIMAKHLNPGTLFGEKFETYLNQGKKEFVDFNEQKKSQQTTPTPTYNKFELPY